MSDSTRAALAEQQGEGLSDEKLLQIAGHAACIADLQECWEEMIPVELTATEILSICRAVLARRGCQPAPHDDRGGALPMIVSDTGASDEPERERIICASISGGADYINNMPRTLTLEKINSEGSTYQKYIQDPTSVMATHPTPQPPALGEGPSADEWDALVKRAWGEHALAEGYFSGEQLMDNSDFGNALDLVRKEFARWDHPAPQPPAEGEAAELVAKLRTKATTEHANGCDYSAVLLVRAAALLQRQQAEIQKLWTWLLACEGSANARVGGSSKPKWHALPLPLPQGEVEQ